MLKFIGTGSAFNTKLGNNSAYYKEGKTLFLIDCGSSTFHRLKDFGVLDGVENIYVYITHTHADHVGSLADLIFYMYYTKGEHKARVEVISNKNARVAVLLRHNGVYDYQYEIQEINTGEIVEMINEDIDLGLTSFGTQHVENLSSTGIILYNEKTSGAVIYTSDTNEVSGNINDLLENDIECLYVDTCMQDHDDNVHLSLKKLFDAVEPKNRRKVWCMHLDETFDSNLARTLGFNVAEVEV